MEQANAIELKNITKRFGEVVANDSVDLSVKHGEILSVLGENGSGKTTLMNMISGIYFPDEGQIFVDGEEVSICSPKDSFALGIGMIHQHFKLVDVLTAAENIILGLEGKSVLDMKKVVQDIQEVTERYGFELDPNQKIYDMSVSQKQTVEIVKMLYRGANILILDEPTAVLTPQETEKLFTVLRNMRDQGKSIIIITHKLNEVLALSDRVSVLRKGKYIGTVETKNATAESLKDDDTIKIRFLKDAKEAYATYSIVERDGQQYLILSLKSAIVRYASERYVEIELLLSEETGLKIPNSAITEKEFYTVPIDFFLKGGDSSDEGILVERTDKDGKSTTEFVTPTIYYETDDTYYIDSEYVSSGDILQKPDSSETYRVGTDTASLKGVYNINKGYAVFKQIDVLYQNEEYTIVKTGTTYGIALYDHIALDGTKIDENQLIK